MTENNLRELILQPYKSSQTVFHPMGSLDQGEYTPLFCTTKIYGTSFTIPAILLGTLLHSIETISSTTGETIINFSLEINGPTTTMRRAGATVVSDMFRYNVGYSRLCKIVTNKNVVYYGMPGIILNANFKPLLVDLYEGYIHNTLITLTGAHVLVSPEVLINQDDLICKTILKEILPLHVKYKNDIAQCAMNQRGITVLPEFQTSFRIEDLSSWFASTELPEGVQNLSEAVNARASEALGITRNVSNTDIPPVYAEVDALALLRARLAEDTATISTADIAARAVSYSSRDVINLEDVFINDTH